MTTYVRVAAMLLVGMQLAAGSLAAQQAGEGKESWKQ